MYAMLLILKVLGTIALVALGLMILFHAFAAMYWLFDSVLARSRSDEEPR